jgi:ABC-type nitrate/sulfonate/bicarbonate transport system permease component
MMRNRAFRILLQLLLPAGLVTLWWFTSADSTSLFYPPLAEVIESFRGEWLFERVGSDLLPSLGRLGLGYFFAVLGGIVGGLALGLSERLRLACHPVIEFLRAVPPPLLLPFAIVTLDIGTTSKVFVIALGSVWPVLLNTIDGVRATDTQVIDMARSYGLSARQRTWRVVLPAASPQIVAGMRTALSIAVILMVISEMIGASNGLGYTVLEAQRSFDSAAMFAGIIVIGIVGVVLNVAFLFVEHRIMRWYQGAKGLGELT